MSNSKSRFIILNILMVVMCAAIIYKLFDLQIVRGKEYKEVADNRLVTNIVVKAPRGEIFDRYGTPLVTNKVGYSIMLQRAGMNDDELNSVIERITDLLKSSNCKYYDTFPISDAPYEYTFGVDTDTPADEERASWFQNNKYNDKYINDAMSAEEVIESFKSIYKISSSYTEEQARRIIGVRYEAELHGFSASSAVTIADDVSVEIVTRIKEKKNDYKGVTIVDDYVRNYEKPGLATHILGRIGKISAEEYAEKSDSYGMNDIIGKQGIEQWAEEYLKGTDGITGALKTINGDEVVVDDNVAPVAGDSVILTIDSELQKTVEDSLAKNIKNVRSQSGNKEKNGSDCYSGAAVVLDIKTGDTLALASYPTYDMSKFDDEYSKLVNDDTKPLWNRAVSGTYSPGSTFKPLVAIAAMQAGTLSPDEIIEDKGVYRFYDDYQPSCWIWSEYHTTHGKLNVSGAIENSCNYFFYEVGRRTGIDTLGEYAAKFGLNSKTGIELNEETSGHMSSPEYKKQVVTNVTSSDWYGGDTLQTAIGQSYSLFTPIELANYTAALANGGTRYKVNLIKSVRSSEDGSIVKEMKPQVAEKIDINPDVLEAVKDGMRKVVDEGSAANIFQNYPIAIGGKTGTAQVGNGSNNALFIAYAPFDDPQIAVTVVLEHGVSGANAAYVARDIFDEYFKVSETQQTMEPETENTETDTGLIP